MGESIDDLGIRLSPELKKGIAKQEKLTQKQIIKNLGNGLFLTRSGGRQDIVLRGYGTFLWIMVYDPTVHGKIEDFIKTSAFKKDRLQESRGLKDLNNKNEVKAAFIDLIKQTIQAVKEHNRNERKYTKKRREEIE